MPRAETAQPSTCCLKGMCVPASRLGAFAFLSIAAFAPMVTVNMSPTATATTSPTDMPTPKLAPTATSLPTAKPDLQLSVKPNYVFEANCRGDFSPDGITMASPR